jgi:hypothetical protein
MNKFIAEKDMMFIEELDKKIEFHRTNQNDPHSIGTAVMVALTEVRDAWRIAKTIETPDIKALQNR